MELELILTELRPFKLSHFWQLFGTMAYNQLLLFLRDSVHTVQTCWKHNEDIHYGFLK